MADLVLYEFQNGVAVLTIDNPPLNILNVETRKALLVALKRAENELGARAVALLAAGKSFTSSTDLGDLEDQGAAPTLGEVCLAIENCPKPVVVAVHGSAMDAGLELALAAHYRLLDKTARLGMTGIRYGMMPSAGASQRLTRLAGPKVALDMLLSGKAVRAAVAANLGLIEGEVDGDVRSAAIQFARELERRKLGPRPVGRMDVGLKGGSKFLEVIAARRKTLEGDPLEAPRAIVDSVEAAVMVPYEAALAMEEARWDTLRDAPQSRALRHVFLAERRAARFGGLEGARTGPVARVGVVGAGTMGRGIAIAALNAGLEVWLTERDAASLSIGVDSIRASYDRGIARGTTTIEERAERLGRLHVAADLAGFKDCDLVIEAVTEDMALKQKIFAELNGFVQPHTILASNTSYLDIDVLASKSGRPDKVIGTHFFSPAHAMRLLEVVVGAKTSKDTVATTLALARALGKLPVRAGVGDGFIVNRLLTVYRQAADMMLEDGASPRQIDDAMRAYGFTFGPYETQDLAGLDIAWARRKRLAATRDPAHRYVAIADHLCRAGRLGQKTRRGWYGYVEGSNDPRPDAAVDKIIAAERANKGITPRAFSRSEIQGRCLAAMANAGAALLAEGIALRPGDIDVAMIHALGFPRWRGGPMMDADLRGLLQVKKLLERLTPEAPEIWTPGPLWDELIKNGLGFGDMNYA